VTRRALPQFETVSVEPTATDTPVLPVTGNVLVFDPAMCCETGVCGPSVDESLLTAARDLRWLTAQGADVTRHNLGQEPTAFVHFEPVRTLLAERGVDALPATWVNDRLLVSGRHATRAELLAALGAPAAE
jgi:arsenite-transporting ATPase